MNRPRDFIAYPFFIAVYAVLALAAKNAAEVTPQDVAVPLLISLATACLALLVGRLITHDRQLGGIIALAIVSWFAWYRYAERFLANQPWLQPLSDPRYAVPLCLLLLSSIPYVVSRRCSLFLPRITRYLNVSTGILVLLSGTVLLGGWGRAMRSTAQPSTSDPILTGNARLLAEARPKPDIYYIILDEYTGSRSLEANYGYSNLTFEDSLRSRGFILPGAPRSNYVHTHLALAAILNWQLLDDRPTSLNHSNGALQLDYDAIENNRTWRYLRTLGYRFVFFPSAYPGTIRNRFADDQFIPPRIVMGEFRAVWSRTTLLLPAGRWWCSMVGCGHNEFPYTPAPATIIDWKFERLGQMPDSAGPLFVFAHFVAPHEPYIFDADCTHREPYWPDADDGQEEPLVKEAYVHQIQCINRKVLKLTSELLRKSKVPPIIILQADHGHGRLGRSFATLEAAGPDRVSERIDPFAAYYLPGHPNEVIYDSITPVNVLPRIFNYYFDARIPLQPDATYWSMRQEPFKFTRIR